MKIIFPLAKKLGSFCRFVRRIHIHESIATTNIIRRNMSDETNSSTTHLVRTEASPRQQVISDAVVTEILQLSQTVKSLSLKVLDRSFTFKPGQWVDFFIPGISTVGGFSICSSPKFLKEFQSLKLAVKFSNHPPALWIHQQCKIGDKVKMRVGGNFFYDPLMNKAVNENLLLIAGGVGINPLYSIVQHVADISDEFNGVKSFTGKCKVLFSAKNRDELLFQDSLARISDMHPKISCKYFVTSKDNITSFASGSDKYQSERISEKDIADVLTEFNHHKLIVFICGPPPMIQNMLVYLKNLGVASNRIKYEKWW